MSNQLLGKRRHVSATHRISHFSLNCLHHCTVDSGDIPIIIVSLQSGPFSRPNSLQISAQIVPQELRHILCALKWLINEKDVVFTEARKAP